MTQTIRKTSISNKQTRKQFQARAIEIVFNGHILYTDILETYRKLKYGLYKMFVKHHKDPKDHTHIGLILREKPKIEYSKLLTYFKLGEVGLIPTLVQPLGKGNTNPIKKLVTYVDYLTDGHDNGKFEDSWNYKFDHELSKNKTKQGIVITLLTRGYTREQIIEQGDNDFKGWCMEQYTKLNTIIDNWRKYNKDDTVYYKTTDFKKQVQDKLEGWDPKKQTLILHGPTNKGKTELAKAICKDITGYNPLLIRNLNLLAHKRVHQPLIFDDMNFKTMRRSKAIALTDIENDSSIRILYGIATIEAGTVQILTTNEEYHDIFPYDGDHGAIQRRIHWIDLTPIDSLYE